MINIVVIEMKYVPIIPCYNPNERVLDVILELIRNNFDKIIVIDDGSNDKDIFEKIKKYKQCIVITHDKNMGKGMALKSGFSYYRDNLIDKYLGVVNIDCDGQHLVKDMINVGNKMIKSNNFVLGVRLFLGDDVPVRNKLGNRITSRIFKWLFGIYLRDTQTGLRGIPNRLIDFMMMIDGERYEYEINMLVDMVRRGEVIEEEKIETIYIDKGKEYSYFKPIKDSYDIYRAMFRRWK